MRGMRLAEFRRRSIIYATLDDELSYQTRFFAAAALINSTFERLVRASSAVRARASESFLDGAGSRLEEFNLGLAPMIVRCRPGTTLDHALVRAEQWQLQLHIGREQDRRPRHWESVRRELNGLLNHRYVSGIAGWCRGAGTIGAVLRCARQRVGGDLDFAAETHRVAIGMALVDHIRAASHVFPAPSDDRGDGAITRWTWSATMKTAGNHEDISML